MSTNYELAFDDEGDPLGCECCDAEVPVGEFNPKHSRAGYTRLCEVCSSTFLSMMDDSRLARSLGWIANKILIEIDNMKQELKQQLQEQASEQANRKDEAT